MSCGSTTCSHSASLQIGIGRPSAVHLPSPLAWMQILKRQHDRWRQRRALLNLDDRLLADIGITREEAEREACKPFWH